MNEKQFRDSITQQQDESKEKIRNGVKERLGIPNSYARKSSRINRRTWIILSSSTAVFLLAVVLTLVFALGGAGEGGKSRYSAMSDCTYTTTSVTLRDYAAETNKSLLYYDWYAVTEDISDYVYTLNDSGEVVCYNENVLNMNTYCYVTIFVTATWDELELLQSYKQGCTNTTAINNVEVHWYGTRDYDRVWFEYDGYRYFIEYEKFGEIEDTLALLGELLPKE